MRSTTYTNIVPGRLGERFSSAFSGVSMEREWYCHHHLLRELMRHELTLAEPELATMLHRRASAWHRDQGDPSEAIHHAAAARDHASASELILRYWLEFRDDARPETLLAWLRALPPGTVSADARELNLL